jgi:hypothetical protein
VRLVDKVGDALLTRLVPGVDARASCGRCQPSGYRCQSCCLGGVLQKRVYFHDACGNYCYQRCHTQGTECPPDRPINC